MENVNVLVVLPGVIIVADVMITHAKVHLGLRYVVHEGEADALAFAAVVIQIVSFAIADRSRVVAPAMPQLDLPVVGVGFARIRQVALRPVKGDIRAL